MLTHDKIIGRLQNWKLTQKWNVTTLICRVSNFSFFVALYYYCSEGTMTLLG